MRTSMMILAATAFACAAEVPSGYYDSLEGKNGATLKSAVKDRISQVRTVDYGDATWEAFMTTDTRSFAGRDAWWDMYSNFVVYVADGHPGMNIEHSVANSWWGGVRNDAYKDLYHLNPSNSEANNRKSNHPLGIVGTASWTNLVSTIGRPADGTGGDSATVFEPADEYKGDFARAYFYVFTLYDDIGWDPAYGWMYDCLSYPALKGWATDMLLKWAAEDPVDSREAARNEAVAAIQGNRNPYIDIPRLAECVWGSDAGPLTREDIGSFKVTERPSAPTLEGFEPVMFNTYSLTWWEPLTLTVGIPAGARGEYSDGSGWEPLVDGTITVAGATSAGETRTLLLRAVAPISEGGYASARTIVQLTALEPGGEDILRARWEQVTTESELSAADEYIVIAPVQRKVMGSEGGTTKQKFMSVAGDVTVGADGVVTGIPVGSAVVGMERSGEGWVFEIRDAMGVSKGWWSTTTARDLRLKSREEAAVATVTVDDGNTVIDFGAPGRLAYNKQSPRFLNYTSNQEPVALYRRMKISDSVMMPTDGTGFGITVTGGRIHAPEGYRVYDLQGRPVTDMSPEPGIYIVTDGQHAVKVVI